MPETPTLPMRSSLRFLVLWFCIATNLFGADPVKTPPIGSPERKAIMDTLRGPIEAKLGQPVIFKVDFLRVNSQWACMNGTPLRPNGSRIDYRKGRAREAIQDGASEDVAALFRKVRGVWQLVTFNIGHGDPVWMNWESAYGAPHSIVGY